MSKSVIIVGAGISGLSAGFYSQLNGFQTTIFESHTIPGGLCTAWKRKGYNFDISMHMVTGSASGPFHQMWKELGVVTKFKFHYHDHISLIEGMGKKLKLSVNRDEMEKNMLDISPDDGLLINEFMDLIFGRDLMNAATLKPAEMQTIFDKVKMMPAMLPVIPTFLKYRKTTIQQFASRFKDPFLREATRFFIETPGWPMPGFPVSILSGSIKSSIMEAGTPLGGSQQVVLSIARQFEKMGGKIQYKSRVAKLLTENGKVIGVKLEDGAEYRANTIIWAADGHTLIFDLLGGKYISDKIKKMYDTWMPVKPVVHVMIGVNRDLSAEPHRIVFQPEETITIAGREFPWVSVIHHCFDKSMAPKGKSAVEVWYDTEYDYWEELAKNRKAYNAEKQRIADYTIAQLEKRWPGFASQVEVVDVPTPYTYHRYTGNWKGSPDGWYITPENLMDMQPVRTLPGLDNLYMVGQWTMPFTGTVMAALSGRQVIQIMRKKDGKKFRS